MENGSRPIVLIVKATWNYPPSLSRSRAHQSRRRTSRAAGAVRRPSECPCRLLSSRRGHSRGGWRARARPPQPHSLGRLPWRAHRVWRGSLRVSCLHLARLLDSWPERDKSSALAISRRLQSAAANQATPISLEPFALPAARRARGDSRAAASSALSRTTGRTFWHSSGLLPSDLLHSFGRKPLPTIEARATSKLTLARKAAKLIGRLAISLTLGQQVNNAAKHIRTRWPPQTD